MGRTGIEIAGWFIGKNDFGATNNGAGDGNALLLTARELIRVIVFTLLKVKTSEGARGLLEARGLSVTSVDKWESYVFNNRKVFDEVEILKNKADFFGAEFGLTARRNAGNIFATQNILAMGGTIKKANNVKKSGFTAAGGAHNHDKLTTFDGEVKIFERKSFGITVTIAFGQSF